ASRGGGGGAVDTGECAREERMSLGSDARLCAAEALLMLGRKEEAGRLLEAEEPLLKERADRDRLRRIKEMRGGRKTVLDAPAYERLADRALREGHRDLALEHYRAARILREAAAPV